MFSQERDDSDELTQQFNQYLRSDSKDWIQQIRQSATSSSVEFTLNGVTLKLTLNISISAFLHIDINVHSSIQSWIDTLENVFSTLHQPLLNNAGIVLLDEAPPKSHFRKENSLMYVMLSPLKRATSALVRKIYNRSQSESSRASDPNEEKLAQMAISSALPSRNYMIYNLKDSAPASNVSIDINSSEDAGGYQTNLDTDTTLTSVNIQAFCPRNIIAKELFQVTLGMYKVINEEKFEMEMKLSGQESKGKIQKTLSVPLNTVVIIELKSKCAAVEQNECWTQQVTWMGDDLKIPFSIRCNYSGNFDFNFSIKIYGTKVGTIEFSLSIRLQL